MVKKFLPILFIFAVWFIFSKPFFIDGKIPFPADLQVNHFALWSSYPSFWGPVKNPAQPDIINQIMPWKKLTIESFKNFQIPFWNPYSFSGTPQLANYQSSSFSITNIFYFLFNFNYAWGLAVLIQPLLAGIFTYIFLRSLRKSELASLISSISFMFCGFITTWMGYTTLALAICFLPLSLFSIEKFFLTKRYLFLGILAICFPLSFFSGHFQTSIYFLIFFFAYLLFKLFDTKDKSAFFQTAIFSFLGILLSLPQILPSIELYFSAYRSSIFQKIETVPFKYLTTIVAPDFYGNPVTRNNFLSHYAEWSSFLGVIPFLLAIYSLFKKNRYVIFFFIMGLLSLLFSLDSPAFDMIVKLKIPVLSTSAASRILVLFSFSFSVLAGFGLDELKTDLENKRVKKISVWVFVCLVIFVFFWGLVLGKIIDPKFYSIALKNLILPSVLFLSMTFCLALSLMNKKLITISLIIMVFLTAFDLLRFGAKWQTFSDPKIIFTTTPIISKMQTLDTTYRTVGAFGAEGSVYFGVPGTEGYDPLYINRYGQLLGSLNDGKIKPMGRSGVILPTNAKFMPKVIDLLGVRYVLLKRLDRNKSWGFPFKKYPEKFNEIYREKDFYLYENKDVYPRAFLAGGYTVEKDDQKIINKILDKNFDLRKNVVLETNPNIKPVNNLRGDAKIIKYSPNQIIVKTNSNNDSILILTDNFYPGWKVKVNGRDKQILRADYTFRAVPISKGENAVEFYFDSETFKLGVYLAIFSAFLIFTIIIGKWYTNRISKPGTKRQKKIKKN